MTMNIFGIGTDIIKNSRIKKLVLILALLSLDIISFKL